MARFILTNKKAQGWGLDAIIAGVIFLVGVVVLYIYAINYSAQTINDLEELYYEGNLASELILSDQNFGILTDDKVDQTKMEQYQFSTNYTLKKAELGVVNNFYFKMENLTVGGSAVSYIGLNSSNVESSIQVTRITVYKDKITKFEIVVWK